MPIKKRHTNGQQEGLQPVMVLVETPHGCCNKYKLDAETGQMKLSKVMPEGMVFPCNFGLFPVTKGMTATPLTC
jgi:inorganic pyrophosphatase